MYAARKAGAYGATIIKGHGSSGREAQEMFRIEIQPQMITFKALQIIGSSQYSMVDVRDYLKFLCEHKEVHNIIFELGTQYSVSDVNLAFTDAKAGKNIKTVLVK